MKHPIKSLALVGVILLATSVAAGARGYVWPKDDDFVVRIIRQSDAAIVEKAYSVYAEKQRLVGLANFEPGYYVTFPKKGFFGSPESRYFEKEAFVSLRCADAVCKTAVALSSEGEELPVERFNLVMKYAGNPVSSRTIEPIVSVQFRHLLVDAKEEPLEDINTSPDMVEYLKTHRDVQSIEFIANDEAKQISKASSIAYNIRSQERLAQQIADNKKAAEARRPAMEAVMRERRAAEERLLQLPKGAQIFCTSTQLLRAGNSIDSLTYRCQPSLDEFTLLRSMQKFGFAVSSVTQSPEQASDFSVAARVSVILTKVR